MIKRLSRQIINKAERPERVLQFGEGVFLRAFADEMIDRLNERGLFDGGIVVVPPTPRGSEAPLNAQDCLYTVLLRGFAGGALKTERRVVTSVSRAINAYADYEAYIACAKNPDLQVVISNTTEAGIAFDENSGPDDRPPLGFPAKVAAFLYERYKHFGGDVRRGLAFLPCELLNDNGQALRECVMRHAAKWGYGTAFADWVSRACVFADTIVDRIVSGFPAAEAGALFDEFGYEDALLDAGEPFHFWAIGTPPAALAAPAPSPEPAPTPAPAPSFASAPAVYPAAPVDASPAAPAQSPEPAPAPARPSVHNLPELLPFHKIGLNVLYTENVGLYADRKLRLLNGAHTMLASAAYPDGFGFVGEAIKRPAYKAYIYNAMFNEIIPTLMPSLSLSELKPFAESILERFANPYVNHRLPAIMLNAASKFRIRIIPSILKYCEAEGAPPKMLTFSFAAFIAYYRIHKAAPTGQNAPDAWFGTRVEDGVPAPYQVIDEAGALEFFCGAWSALNLPPEPRPGPDAASFDEIFALTRRVLANGDIWGADMNAVTGLAQTAAAHLSGILRNGTTAALETALNNL